MKRCLVIGYGNELRGDDAAGQIVAREIGRRNLPGVRALSVAQLLPELADDLAHADEVIFVDACADTAVDGVAWSDVTAESVQPFSAHSLTPPALLALTQKLYQCSPRVRLLSLGVASFSSTDGLSEKARLVIPAAVSTVESALEKERAMEGLKMLGHQIAKAVIATAAVLLPLSTAQTQDGVGRGIDWARSRAPHVRVTTLVENGGRLDWSERNNLIVFDRRVGDGYFDIYTITPEGTNESCLTCGKKELPPKSRGNPAWHPSGDYIVFQAQNNYRGLGKITDYFANPGAGINNNVWVMDSHGTRFWQVTSVKPRVGGMLHPQFSRQGDRLFWSERIGLNGPWGEWALQVANFHPSLFDVNITDVRLHQPGTQRRMYESHGFSPDGEQVLFSGNLERGQDETGADIYLFNLRTTQLKNLTQTQKEWDEHAHFSPDGQTIIWMSSKDLPDPKRGKALKTDYWLMDADGNNKRRLTYFNSPNHSEYLKQGVIAADSAWSPDGTRIAAYLITDVRKGGKIVIIDMQ